MCLDYSGHMEFWFKMRTRQSLMWSAVPVSHCGRVDALGDGPPPT